MSRSTMHTLTCPCGQVFSSQIYEYVNVAQDPQLQYIVQVGLLNAATCPNCKRRAVIAQPFIYSDPAHQLLAYVHPRADAPNEARLLILEKLRSVYVDVTGIQGYDDAENGDRRAEMTPEQAHQMPPLQVVFGQEQLSAVISAVQSPEERLGKLAMRTQSRDAAERSQFLTIARKLAADIGCNVEVEDQPDEYTVWLYGSRRQIGLLMRELEPHG